MLTRKASSLIMWSVTFGAVVAALALIQISLKSVLKDKIKSSGDYLLWTKWGGDPEDYERDKNSRTRSNLSQWQDLSQIEQKEKFLKNIDSSSREVSVSAGVSEGSEPLLDTVDLNTYKP